MSLIAAHRTGLILIFVCLVTAVSYADTTQTERRVEENKLQILEEAPSAIVSQTKAWTMENGGWLSSRFTDFDNSDNDSENKDNLDAMTWQDLRLWTRFKYGEEAPGESNRHSVYIRLKDIYTTRSGEAPGERFDNKGPILDQGYYSFNARPWKIETGRRYFNIGRGIAYSGVHDGLQINHQRPGWNVGWFLSQSQPHESNIDFSIPGYDKSSRRVFSGLGLGYAGIKDHQLYSFGLIERDHSKEQPEDEDQEYTYDANYFGAGSKGQWGRRWPYWVEAIYETGESREYLSNARSNIKAWALDAQQKYVTAHPSALIFSAEYAQGSGDGDRQSVTNTRLGNQAGRDRNFLYFGYLPTGIALAPTLSNLRMIRIGADFYPFFRLQPLRKILLAIDYFWYWKDAPRGAIYDPEASENARDIGQELDLRLDWRVQKNLILSTEWGHFFPADAYHPEANDSEETFSAGITWIF